MKWVYFVISIVILAILPVFISKYLVSIILTLCLFFIVAQSYDLMGGFMGYINLSHYGFFGIGAYVFSIFLSKQVSLPFCFFLAIVGGVLFAILVSYPLFRLKGDYFALGTLALLVLLEILSFNLPQLTRGAKGLALPPSDTLIPAYYLALAITGITLAVCYKLIKSKFGIALLSIREDEVTAETFGVPVQRYKNLTYLISASFASIAGAIQAWYLGYIDPTVVFGLDVALVPIVMALFGGTGTILGPLVGVMTLGLLEQFIWAKIPHLHFAIYGAILIGVGLFMPGGIVRSKWYQTIFLRGKEINALGR